MELLDHRVIQFLIFWGETSILFTTIPVPSHIPTNSEQGLFSPYFHHHLKKNSTHPIR